MDKRIISQYELKKMRNCSPLLEEPGCQVVIQLLDHIDATEQNLEIVRFDGRIRGLAEAAVLCGMSTDVILITNRIKELTKNLVPKTIPNELDETYLQEVADYVQSNMHFAFDDQKLRTIIKFALEAVRDQMRR